MKKFLFLLLFISSINYTYSFDLLDFFNSDEEIIVSEEDACIQNLNNSIKNDSRFNDPNVFKNSK
jgi:hypothetical protein